MDSRFTEIKPFIIEEGMELERSTHSEPSLYDILTEYYQKNGSKTPSFRTALHLGRRGATIASVVW